MQQIILVIFIQIITESLPISSSGHYLLFQLFLQKYLSFNFYDLPKFFDYFLHGPTILIIILFFYKNWFPILKRLLEGFLDKNLFKRDSYKNFYKIIFKIFNLVFVATLSTSVSIAIIKLYVEKQNWFYKSFFLLFGFIITAVLLFLLKKVSNCKQVSCHPGLDQESKTKHESLNYKKAIILGFVQGVAILPGISRFAIVYVFSRLLKISVKRSFQITFLLELPVIIPGFFIGVLDLNKINQWQKIFSWKVNLSILIASVFAFWVLKLVYKIVNKQKFYFFSFYMLIPILILIFVLFI